MKTKFCGSATIILLAAVLSVLQGHAVPNFAVDLDRNPGPPATSVDGKHTKSYEQIEGELTMEAWIFPRDDPEQMVICNKENSWMLELANGALRAGVRAKEGAFLQAWSFSGGSAVRKNQWSHVAAVYSNNQLSTFVNGKEKSREAALAKGQIPSISKFSFRVGIRGLRVEPNLGGPFNGLIDEVRISNVVRYQGNFPVAQQEFEPDDHTIVLYHFNEPPGSDTAIDASKHQNDATLTGAAKFVRSNAPIVPQSVEPAAKLTTTWGRLKSGDNSPF